MPEVSSATEPCAECGGSGWVIEPDGRAGTARPCECQKRGLAGRLLLAAGIPERYESCSLENFKTASPGGGHLLVQAHSVAQLYVDEFLTGAGRFRESGLLFIGPPGAGKTHLAVGVLKALIQRYGVRGKFVDFTSLIHQIQSTFDPASPDSKRDVLDPVMSGEFLLLDELGAQKPTAWVNDTLYLILNTRYTRRLPTIFTTNYRLELPQAKSLDRGADSQAAESLSARIPAMLLSRLYEMAQPLVMDSPDFRREVKMHQHQRRLG